MKRIVLSILLGMIISTLMVVGIVKVKESNDISQVNEIKVLSPIVREIVEKYVEQQQKLQEKRELQEWWKKFVKKYPGAKPYVNYINWVAGEFGIDPRVIACVIIIESGWNPRAISKKGAEGLMQLMPATAYEIQPIMNPYNPYDCIWLGSFYLRKLIDTFGSLEAALAAYNMGPGNFQKFLGKNLDPDTYFYVMRFKESIQSFA